MLTEDFDSLLINYTNIIVELDNILTSEQEVFSLKSRLEWQQVPLVSDQIKVKVF